MVLLAIVLLSITCFSIFHDAYTRVRQVPLDVLFSNPQRVHPQISPDGSKMGYLAPVGERLNIWVRDMRSGEEHPITTQQEQDIHSFGWAYDNINMLFTQDTKGDENDHVYLLNSVTLEQVDLTPFQGAKSEVFAGNINSPDDILVVSNKENHELFDVYHINLKTHDCSLVLKNPGGLIDFISDANLKIRAAKRINPDGSNTLLYRATEESPWQELESWDWQETRNVGSFCFSADGKKLYFVDPKDSNTSQGVCLNLETGERTIVAHDDKYDVGGFLGDDFNNIWASVTTQEKTHLHGLTPEYEKLIQTLEGIEPEGQLVRCSFTSHKDKELAKQQWILGFDHDNRSATYYFFDGETGASSFLFSAKPQLDKYLLSHTQPIQFTSRDGLTIHGYLTLPRGPKKKNFPLVLYVHGGPWDRDAWHYDPYVQFFTNRGYACLQVNFRGSTGYGKAFLNAGNKEWGGKMHDDLIDAVNWAVGQKIANPQKVAIFGGSYGGYAALVGATFTPDLFCCAIDYVGISNLISFIKSIPPYWKVFQETMALRIGRLETEEEFLKSRSPLFKIDAIKIPLLIIQGANDPRVNKAESDQIVEAMRAKNLPVEYILFGDEGHGARGEKNNIAIASAMESFLAKYLG